LNSQAPGLRRARSGAVLLGALVLVLAGCASSAQLLWEEYTNAGLGAYRAGQYNRAAMYLNRAVQKAEELGPQELGRSLNNLGELARRRGQTAEAERLFTRALAVKEMLGKDHPDVATSLNNLAQVHVVQGRDADAIPLLERSLAIQENALDPEHPALRRSLTALGDVYRRVGRPEEAFIVDVRARMLREEENPPPGR
jgi:tetratricopeptide (TPR) repeat protein